MIYLIKFDENGRRGATYVKEEKTEEQVAELKAQGYLEISETDYALLLGNIDGKEYVRIGEGQYKPYVPPEPSEEEKYATAASAVRAKRDDLLDASDYFLAIDYPANDSSSENYSPEDVAEVKLYRKELRDITETKGFPFDVTFPEVPSCLK